MRKQLIVLSGAALLAGCADVPPVGFEMPVNRLEIPERGAGVVHIESGAGGGNYLTLTRNRASNPPDPQHPEFGNCPHDADRCSAGVFIRGDVRLSDYVQLGVRRSFDTLAVGQAKVYLLGPKAGQSKPGDNSLALTLGYGWDHGSAEVTETGNAKTDLHRHLFDTALIFGHRWQKWLLSYGGVSYSDHVYSGTYAHNSTTSDFDGSAHMVGFNAGLKFDFGTDIVGGILECATAHVTGGATSDTINRCAAGVEVTFGNRHRDTAAPTRPAPASQRPAPKR